MASGLNEVRSIIREIDSIISEVERVQGELRGGFEGVGTEICANKLNWVVSKLEVANRSLRRID